MAGRGAVAGALTRLINTHFSHYINPLAFPLLLGYGMSGYSLSLSCSPVGSFRFSYFVKWLKIYDMLICLHLSLLKTPCQSAAKSTTHVHHCP